MPIATSDQPVTSPNKYRRDADDFATDMRARQATPSVDQGTELSGTTQNLDDQIIIQAQGAATRLIAGASWQDWIAVARAYQIARNRAQYEAGTNQPKGSKYTAAMSRSLTTMRLDKVADKATRSRLLNLVDHLEAVEKWRQTLTTNRRLELNHPNTVWRHWRRSQVPIAQRQPRPPSPVAKLKESLVAAEEEVARLKEANGGNLFTSKTSAKDVVRILRETFSTSKLNEIRKLLKAVE